jgi:hypothetical protein
LYDQQVATLLPAFRERYAKAKLEAERACVSAMQLYVLPTLSEVRREHYGTYRSQQSRRLASQGEARLLFTREQSLELVKSGILEDGIFAMVNVEGMIARDEKVSQPFEDALQDVMKFRALYRMERGYLGLGPRSAECGDEVWLLQGARVPFVLRKNGEKFKLVGETYLHGFMDGRMAREVGGKIGGVSIV